MPAVRWSATRQGLVAPVSIDPAGRRGPTEGQARGAGWRRSSRGLYVPAGTAASVDQRIVEAGAVLREEEAVTGWAALRWSGATWFDGTRDGVVNLDVPVVARRHLVAQRGFSVSQEFLHPDGIEVVEGLPVTAAVRSVVFEMRYAAGLGDAIIALDMACYSDKVSLSEVASYLQSLGPVTGIQQARDALAEAEENSWSPQETKMRGVWTRLAGLVRPLCNAPVFTLHGEHVGTPDLIDPQTGLLGLYNGSDHLSLVGASTDLKQESTYRNLGLEPVTMLATDWVDLRSFIERLHSAGRRAREVHGPRAWTVEPPAWWTPTHTVDRRRALDAGQRARLLRYRRAA
jgi:hypothetical protein